MWHHVMQARARSCPAAVRVAVQVVKARGLRQQANQLVAQNQIPQVRGTHTTGAPKHTPQVPPLHVKTAPNTRQVPSPHKHHPPP